MRGIYMLCKDGKVMYIGKSSSIRSRVYSHKSAGKKFDSVVKLTTSTEADMHIMEIVLINFFKPEYNMDSKSIDTPVAKIVCDYSELFTSIIEYNIPLRGEIFADENIITMSPTIIRLYEFLASIGSTESNKVTKNLTLSVVQKTALALYSILYSGNSTKKAVEEYGVSICSIKIAKQKYSLLNCRHRQILTDVMNGNSSINSVPALAKEFEIWK